MPITDYNIDERMNDSDCGGARKEFIDDLVKVSSYAPVQQLLSLFTYSYGVTNRGFLENVVKQYIRTTNIAYASSIASRNVTFSNTNLNGRNILFLNSNVEKSQAIGPDSQAGGYTRPTDRLLVHEFAHLIANQGDQSAFVATNADGTVGLNMSEQVATVLENLFYSNRNGRSGPTYVYTHLDFDRHPRAPQAGVLGVEVFNEIALPIVSFSTDPGGGGIVLTSTNSNFVVMKTHHFSGYRTGPYAYDNFISVSAHTTDGSQIVSKSGSITSFSSVFNRVLSGVMHSGDVAAAIENALIGATNVAQMTGVTFTHSFTKMAGVGADRFVDGVNDDDGHLLGFIDFAGVLGHKTLRSADVITHKLADGAGGILVVAAGFKNADWSAGSLQPVVTPGSHNAGASNDVLFGGNRSDILVVGQANTQRASRNQLNGGAGDDVLIGSAAGDVMRGGDDNDLLIATPGQDEMFGDDGTDVAYFGLIDAIVFRDGKATGVGIIVGSRFSDTFYGAGTGRTFHGNERKPTPGFFDHVGDTYFAADGPDKFLDDVNRNTLTNTLDFSLLTNGIDLTMTFDQRGTTTAGHVFSGMASFVGNAQVDVMRFDLGQEPILVKAGDGKDVIHANSKGRFYGEAKDDTFVIYHTGYNVSQLIDGGDGDDTLDLSRSQGTRINVGNKTFTTGSGDLLSSYVSIEKIVYGAGVTIITGGAGGEEIRSAAGNSHVFAGGGNDEIIGIAVVAGRKRNEFHGEGGDDTIRTESAALLDGGADNDEFLPGTGNDTVFAYGGNEVFGLSGGIDNIDAGSGLDTFSGSRFNDYDLFLIGEDLAEFGVQQTGVTRNGNASLFVGLEQLKFQVSHSNHGYLKVEDARAALLADADHYMTGAELSGIIGQVAPYSMPESANRRGGQSDLTGRYLSQDEIAEATYRYQGGQEEYWGASLPYDYAWM